MSFAFDWQRSTPHLMLLANFLKLRPAGELPPLPAETTWEALLEEPPEQAIKRFRALGLLVSASLHERLEYHFTVAQLQALARARGLDSSGPKAALVARLAAADELGMYAALPRETLLRCSDRGRAAAEQFLTDPDSVRRLGDARWVKVAIAVLTFLLVDAVIAGVVGDAAYDLLKALARQAGVNVDGVPRPARGLGSSTRLALGVKLEWCYVPAGYFWMGSDARDSQARDDEKPRHRLYLPGYYVGKYPVTNAQYQLFVQAGGPAPDYWTKGQYPAGEADHPVRYVSWDNAVAFCRWAAGRTGQPIRLLTEAEWEKACRGSDGRIWPWGNRWQPAYANVENQVRHTTPVGRYPRGASPYGALDMIGNVWEWTSSLGKPYPYRADDGREDLAASGYRVFRGGSWYSDSTWARAAYRYHYRWVNWGYGFRVGVAAPFSPPLISDPSGR